MFGKAFSSVFGASSPLRNEPTIDYNNTLPSFGSNVYESTVDSLNDRYIKSKNNGQPQDTDYHDYGINRSRVKDPNWGAPYNSADDSIYGVRGGGIYRPRSTVGASYDRRNGVDTKYPGAKSTLNENINSDGSSYRAIHGLNRNQIIDHDFDDDSDEDLNYEFNAILNNMTKTNEKLMHNDTHTLPSNYPGKFMGVSKAEPTYNPAPVNYENTSHTSTLNREIESLQREIDREESERQKIKATAKDGVQLSKREQLKEVVDRLTKNNEFLTNMNDLVDLNGQNVAPPDLGQKYEALKAEYLNELKNMETFYKAYYKLMFKYRTLKSNKKKTSTSVREKINLIRASTTQSSIKTLCDGLIADITHNDDMVMYYKEELAKAHERIAQLEGQTQK